MSFKFEKYALGGFGDNTVVDVDALPTENIDQSKIYRVTSGTETTYGIPDETKKLYVFKGGVETKTFAVDDTFPRYTPTFEAASHINYAKVSDIIFDDITEYLKDEYTVDFSSMDMGVMPLSGLQYDSNFNCYHADVVILSTDASTFGFGTTGVFVAVEANGTSFPITATLPMFTGEWVEVGAGGGGTCAGGIIDVTELPTENIDENAVYKVIGEEGVEAWYVIDANTKLSLGDFFLTAGVSTTITYYLVDALPATLEASDFETFSMLHVYIVSDTGVCYVSQDAKNVMTLGTLLSNVIGDEIGDRGWAEDIASIGGTTEAVGIYAVILPATTTYGVSTDASTVVYGYNGYSWEELAVKETLLASANFTDYAELTVSVDGIVMTGLSAPALTYLKIQGNVTSIGTRACNEQGALKSVIIPSSVTSIGDYAFLDCASMTSIIYNGTKAQWKAITKGEIWDGANSSGDFIITCTDGTIAKDGTET